MCFGRRNKDEADATRSRELDKILKADEKRMQKEVKLLLLGMAAPRTSPAPPVLLALPTRPARPEYAGPRLRQSRPHQSTNALSTGAGESGKSTVLKQMKLIYATGFSKNEKLEWKPVVFNNIVQSFRLIYDAMNELSIPFEQPESEVRF